MKYFFLPVLILTACSVGFAQNYTFKVLANKGANKVKTEAGWSALKTGASLQMGEVLQVSEKAYLGLVHVSGRTLELKSAGTYNVEDLSEKIEGPGSTVASKYADYVLSKMSAEGKKNRLSATGAVHRGSSEAINIFMPNSAGVYNDQVTIRWDSVGDFGGYMVVFRNMFDDILMEIETDRPKIDLDLTNEKIASENVLLISVTTKGQEPVHSSVYALKKLQKEDALRVEKSLNNLMSGVEEVSALNKYILAGFYEENNLLIDALTSYEDAIALAPEVDSYKDAYLEFLLRNRLRE